VAKGAPGPADRLQPGAAVHGAPDVIVPDRHGPADQRRRPGRTGARRPGRLGHRLVGDALRERREPDAVADGARPPDRDADGGHGLGAQSGLTGEPGRHPPTSLGHDHPMGRPAGGGAGVQRGHPVSPASDFVHQAASDSVISSGPDGHARDDPDLAGGRPRGVVVGLATSRDRAVPRGQLPDPGPKVI